jgi:hypothetical protein
VFSVWYSTPVVIGLSSFSSAECTPAVRGFTVTRNLTAEPRRSAMVFAELNVPSLPTHDTW